MKKLTYAIALSSLLLAGCSQDEGIMENKGELVTLNYNLSLGNNVQSRTGGEQSTTSQMKYKLLCAVYQVELDNGNNVTKSEWKYTESVYDEDIENGIQFSFSPQVLKKFNYKIVFFSCSEINDKTCFTFDQNVTLESIKPNYDIYNVGDFSGNIEKDAFVGSDLIIEGVSNRSKSITLTRPFSQVNVLTSVEEYKSLNTNLGKTPDASILTFSSLKDTYNALTGEWSGNLTDYSLRSSVNTSQSKTIDGVDYYYLANEYLFASGDNPTCKIQIYSNDDDKPIYEYNVENFPLSGNTNTNLYNPNLLTGGGITYTITLTPGFTDNNENNKPIESTNNLNN